MIYIITILLIPMIFAIGLSYIKIPQMIFLNTSTTISLICGFVIYIPIHFNKKINKIIGYLYVISHELTHALFAIITGNAIKKIHISSKNGYVSFKDKPTKITAIAPYIFPFYNFIFAISYIIITAISKKKIFYFFLVTQSFFLSFHIFNTIEAISINQKDFKMIAPRLISVIIIILINLFILSIVLLLFSPSAKTNIAIFIKYCINNYFIIMKKIYILTQDFIKYLLPKLKL